jgi:hypothetical protein
LDELWNPGFLRLRSFAFRLAVGPQGPVGFLLIFRGSFLLESATPPTQEQSAIMDAEAPLVAITAYAGAGKTSTLRFFSKKRPRAKTLYLAFNRTMAEDAQKTFFDCPQVETRTIHSLAFKFRGRDYQSQLVRSIRPLDLMEPLRRGGLEDNYYFARILCDLLNRFQMSSKPTMAAFLKKESRFLLPNIALALKKPLTELKSLKKAFAKLGAVAGEVWTAMVNKTFPITHNGYLKLFQLDPVNLGYDWVLVDEAQDLNDCMIDLILGLPGRKILVGDPYQQIYEWNGAVNALNKTAAHSEIYYLTRSFRCPPPVAGLANQVLKLLSAPKNFLSASVDKPRVCGPTAIIARTTYGVFKFAVENCQKHRLAFNGGLPAYEFDVVKDIYYLKSNKPNLIRSSFLKNFDTFENLSDYVERAEDVQLASKIKLVERYQSEIIPLYDLIAQKEARIQDADYTLTTAHRVKGQEFGSVIVSDDFIDLPGICQTIARLREKHANGLDRRPKRPANVEPIMIKAEEIRLIYVAITRSWGYISVEPQYNFSDHFVADFLSLKKGGWLKII